MMTKFAEGPWCRRWANLERRQAQTNKLPLQHKVPCANGETVNQQPGTCPGLCPGLQTPTIPPHVEHNHPLQNRAEEFSAWCEVISLHA